MSVAPEPARVLFVDRDGTLIEEPPDEQVDALEKVRFMPGVFRALGVLRRSGFRLVMVTNQNGIGSAHFPQAAFEVPHAFVVQTFASQGIEFDAVFVCPHLGSDGCACRKPRVGLVERYLREANVDLAASAMVGDRDTDLEFARNVGVRGLRVRHPGTPDETWDSIVRELTARRARVERTTKETRVVAAVELDVERPASIATGIGFFDHMLAQLAAHGGFALDLACKGDLHVDEHHTVEDTAIALGEAVRRALGDKAGIGRYGFVLPMDEARVQVAIDLSGRGHAAFEGRFARDQVGALPTELVPHFFRSFGDALGAAIHIGVTGDNTHHMIEACFKGVGRALRQALRREAGGVPSTKGVL